MYAVTGSTGQVGRATVKALLRAGKKVRALVRTAEKAEEVKALGAEAAIASLEDPSAIEAAFQEVEGVFLMTPPAMNAPDPRSENRCALAALQHAIKAAHVRRVVCLSSIGAQHDRGTGLILKLYDMEQTLFRLPIEVASIRAGYFMENFGSVFPTAKAEGVLPTLQDDTKQPIPMIATQDIGELAAKLLMEPWHGHRIVELEGPQRYSIEQVAGEFSKLAGKTVQVSTIPAEARQGLLQGMGLSGKAVDGMIEMAHGIDAGQVAFEGGAGVTHVKGATTLAEVYRGR